MRARKYKKVKYTEVSYKHHSYECLKALNEKQCKACSCSFPQVCVPGHGKYCRKSEPRIKQKWEDRCIFLWISLSILLIRLNFREP